MRFTIKTKLTCAFGAVILLSMTIGGIAYYRLSALDESQQRVVAQAVRLKQASDLMNGIQGQARAELRMVHATSEKETQDNYNLLVSRQENVLKLHDEIYAAASEAGKKLLDQATVKLKRMNQLEEQAAKLAQQEIGGAKAAVITNGDGRTAFNETLEGVEAYVKHNEKQMEETASQGSQEAASAKMVLIITVVASLLIALASAIWIALNISRGLSRAVGLADAVALGDLSQKIDVSSNDEVGDLIKSLNTTVEKLRSVVSEAMTAAQNVSASSQELSASAEQLSQGATEQASSAEEASSSMEEMASNVKQNADNANQTEKIAAQSAKDA